NKNRYMNTLSKKLLIFMGIFLVFAILPIEKSFASTSSTIKVNDIEVNITRDLGGDTETYTIDTNHSLQSFSIKFNDQNKIDLAKEEGGIWNITMIYKGSKYNGSISGTGVININDDNVNVNIPFEVVSEEEVSFHIDSTLSDKIFDKMLVNHDPFTLTARSSSENITVERENSGGKDKYTFSSDQALGNVEVRDGTDNIIILWNGTEYNISGQYKNVSKTYSLGGTANAILEYNDIKVGVVIEDVRKKITLSSDHETIERIAQMILDEKRNIKEKAITADETFEIPSNSNLSTINASGEGGSVKFVVDNNTSSINKEITVNYNGNAVIFPAGTGITGPDGWNGEMSLPKIEISLTVSPSVSGHSVSVLQTITIGTEGNFTFNKPVQLIFKGHTGKRVGFIKGNIFTEIEACNDLNNIPDGKNDCKYSAGSDLIVLTKHFTEFVVFSASPIGGGGGGSVYSFSNVSSDVQSNQVVVTFNVSPAASTFLRYGTVQGGPYTELTSGEVKSSHSFTLTELNNATYYYRVGASSDTSAEYSFTYSATESSQPSGSSVVPVTPVTPQEDQATRGDLNNDGVVDEYDFSLLMANWGKTGDNPYDLNNDGVVDEYDFSLLMAKWTI
ncbi:MAG: dockerin type I domain-containing protein, partial [Candidatus Pacebacteria bacterium]|nr:dockerin type I domain-containing protein [Candidatus Paceibacterota bacterium]